MDLIFRREKLKKELYNGSIWGINKDIILMKLPPLLGGEKGVMEEAVAAFEHPRTHCITLKAKASIDL